EWQAIVAAVSSIVGIFTFVAILFDVFTAGTATGVIVAAIVGISSALAAATNFKNGFEKQKPDSTYLAIDGNYTQSATDYIRGLEELITNVWDNTELGSSGIAEALGSGAWLEVPNPLNVTGIGDQARDWIDNLLVTSYINRVFTDANAYILFLAYGDVGDWGKGIREFTKEECENHWANNPGWAYYATCDVSLGSGGKEGMAVVTRPRQQGEGSKDWTSKVEFSWADYDWNAHAYVESSVYGYAEYGFNYNLTNINFGDLLQGGSQEAIEQWKTLPLSTPGLFNTPVCEIFDMVFLPNALQVQKDMGISKHGVNYADPCYCKYSNSTAGGETAMFLDNVGPAIKKAVDCKII
ncbi:MAG: hypothetical protein Q9174_007413, partial [Haloplaca sp. 1 TL-2023]